MSALLTPAAVAELLSTPDRPCSRRAVQQACQDGTLRCRPVVGAGGRIATYAVTEAAARAWDAVRQIGAGRPVSSP